VSDNLPDDPETLKAMLLAERHESERLRQIIKELQRHRFGRKAESLPEEQMLLGLEDVQQVAACTEASQDETTPEGRAERARKRRNNRGALPAHLPRIEVVVDIDDKTCPCCKGELHRISPYFSRGQWLWAVDRRIWRRQRGAVALKARLAVWF
jgi:hypothetical protein